MKPQNNEFLTTLLGKYREFEGVLHGNQENGSTKRKTKIQGVEHGAAPEMLAYEVREKALSILAEISSIVSSRSEGRKYQGKEGEERMTRGLSRFLTQNPQAQEVYREELGIMGKKKITKMIPTMDDLLDEIGVSVGEILSESQSLVPDIYRTSAKGGKCGVEGEDQEGMEVYNGIITGSGNGLDEVRIAPKYEIVMQVLSSLGVDPRNVSVTTESINPERMRKYPYKIVHIIGENVSYPLTLTVSDEIGQSSYIYPGYVDLGQFIEAKKGSELSGVVPEEVVYGEKYRERMAEVIERMLRGEEGFGKRKSIEGKKRGKGDDVGNIGAEERGEENGNRKDNGRESIERYNGNNDDTSETSERNLVTNLTPEILRYQAILLSHREALKEVGILEKKIGDEMVWCFDEAKGCANWPRIGGRSLVSFPNQGFNRARGIGNQNGQILSSQELAKMFEALGLQVATDQEYISLWREELLSERGALRKAGIVERQISNEMIWCFDETKGNASGLKIGERNLKSFPNGTFNKARGIGNKNGTIQNSQELAKMFEVLGLQVATDEEYVSLWREELLSHREALKEAGILEKKIGNEMIWCFDEAKGNDNWPRIGGRSLMSFPNGAFNKLRGIGNTNGLTLNPQELAKMFEVLGLRVATDEEYILLQEEMYEQQIPLWREKLLSHQENLKEVGIVERRIGNEIVWYFDNVKGCDNWPNIGEKNLMSFPNSIFNKTKGIGNKDGTIRNFQELAKMFEVLGLRVKHPEKKKKTD